MCSAANDAIELLARCGISPRKPLHVQIRDEVRHPFSGPVFGMFDVKRELALVTAEANIAALIENTPYAGLPKQAFYKSLIVHEVVHSVMHQNLKRKATTQAAYEYPAYALQIESLPADIRQTFLRSFEQTAGEHDTLFNDAILHFSPYYFAARAYRHFKASPDACAHLTSLLADAASFIVAM